MIERIIRLESIANTFCKTIVVPLNIQGCYRNYPGYNEHISTLSNDVFSSFASFLVRYNIVPEFNNHSRKQLGDIVTVKTNDTIFLGIVCYDSTDLIRQKSPEAITRGLETVRGIITNDETVAFALGEELVTVARNNFGKIIETIHASVTKIALYNPMIEGDPLYGYSVPDYLKHILVQ